MAKNTFLKKALAVAAVMLFCSAMAFAAEKPQILKPCTQCHQAAKNKLMGTVGSVSAKAEAIQIETGATWIVKFDEKTKINNWQQPVNKIPKEKEIAISFVEKDGKLYAEAISVKPPAKIKDEQLIKAEELSKLIALGADKGNYIMVDSRPAPRFNEGHIPGAINIYDADFDKNIEKLPKEKDKVIVFYCAGPT
ncbi:MAG: rhodanese-like domain-containing protein [Nitrospirae bacterium]|nr:MAG: rhodanese-like domain-containing protein [Nitrospirota bacterium]